MEFIQLLLLWNYNHIKMMTVLNFFSLKLNSFATNKDIHLPDIPRQRKIPSRLGGSKVIIINNIPSYLKVNIYFPIIIIRYNN